MASGEFSIENLGRGELVRKRIGVVAGSNLAGEENLKNIPFFGIDLACPGHQSGVPGRLRISCDTHKECRNKGHFL